MSHYSVLVALPGTVQREDLEAAIGEVMAPYDENMEVEPYRSYEDGGPEEYWFVSTARREAENYRLGAGLKPHDPNGPTFTTESSKKTAHEQRLKQAEWAEYAQKLGDHPTWEQVIRLYREKYPDDTHVPLYDPETSRAYQMTTYNPESKWDYWRIGGRWGSYFRIGNDSSDIIRSERGDHCDGGRKRDLDLDGLRREKASDAEAAWDEYRRTVDGTPDMLPWHIFAERVDQSGNGGYSIDDARRDYRVQDRVKVLAGTEKFRWFDTDDLADFETLTSEQYAERAAARAVPGYATVDAVTGGGWFAPGRMGWFGMSSDDSESYARYVAAINDFIAGLPEDTWLIVLDCHI